MGSLKKTPDHPQASGAIGRYLSRVSKAAMTDALLDAIGLVVGHEDPSLEDVQRHLEPRLIARGDNIPKVAK